MADDPKLQIGAYLAVWGRLFEVRDVCDGQALAVNCQTGYVAPLDRDDLAAARLIVPLTDEAMVDLELAVTLAAAPDPQTVGASVADSSP